MLDHGLIEAKNMLIVQTVEDVPFLFVKID